MRKHILTCFIVLFATGLSFSQDTICGGQTHTLQAGNPLNLTSVTYSMNPGANVSSNGIFVFSPAATASYTLYTTGKIPPANTQDTTTIEVIEVVVNPQPITAVTVTNITCASDTNAWDLNETWLPSGTVPSYTVSWLPDATTIPVVPPGWGNNATEQRDSVIAAGNYSAVITTEHGCADTAYFTITTGPAKANFSLSPSPDYLFTCLVRTISVAASSSISLTYTFTSNSTAPNVVSSIVLTPTNLGSWSVTAVHPVSGCVRTVTFSVSENTIAPVSTISETFQAVNCASPAIAVTVCATSPTVNFTHFIKSPPPQNLVWSANSNCGVYPPGPPGVYTYSLMNNVTGCVTSKNFTITSSSNFPTFGINSVPAGFTVGCGSTATTTVNYVNPQSTIPPGGGPASYTILPPNFSGTVPPPPASLGLTLAYPFTAPGSYTAIVRDMTNFCETRIPFSIVQNIAAPKLDSVRVPRNILNCFTHSTVIEAFSSTENVSYSWSFVDAGGVSSQATKPYTVQINPFTAPENELINNYTITVTDEGNKCITTATVPMYQNLYKPNAAASLQYPSITCITNTVLITNNSSSGIPPNHPLFPAGQPVIAFYWEGPTPQVPLSNSTTYTAQIAGTYTIHARDLNNGCESTGTVNIVEGRVFPLVNFPNTDAPVPLGCGDASVVLAPTYSNMVGSETYSWAALQGQITSDTRTLSTFAVQDTGLYLIKVTNPASGCTDTDTMYVISDTLVADIGVQGSNRGYAPFEVTFINESRTDVGNSGISTMWSFGIDTVLLVDSGFVLPKITYTQPGTYTVVAFASKGQCLDTAYQIIEVDIPSDLVIPNIFTPNGDGVNDLFFLQRTVGLSQLSAQIYDRWGNLVYEVSSDKQNIEWDGKTQYGKESPAGTYYYIITATGRDGKSYDQKGTLTLVR